MIEDGPQANGRRIGTSKTELTLVIVMDRLRSNLQSTISLQLDFANAKVHFVALGSRNLKQMAQ